MDKYIGKMLDNRYEILEVIGTGGMAIVYKAKCHRLNRMVAIKILKDDYAQDADFRRRFHAESQAVAMLSHPNIVAVYDVSRSSTVEYIVMELIDGITLKQYMQRKGKLSWRESLHFVTQIVKALSHAHSRGIIHRDIKPHNIMVLRDGSVKVADFGIARFASTQNTLTQEALGSVHYISPEQARGSHIDARSDIYSVGVVLYEMLTSRLPYEGDSPVSIAIQHINSMPLSPREVDPSIPEALELITMKAMSSDVSRRYYSAEEMLYDLEEFRKNPNIEFGYEIYDPSKDEENEPTRKMLPVNVKAEGVARRDRADVVVRKDSRRERYASEADYDDYGRRRSGVRIAAYGAGVLVIIGVMVLLGWFLVAVVLPIINPKPEETLSVPNFIGMTMDEAEKETVGTDGEVQFVLSETEGKYSEKYPAGEIMLQKPVAGTQVKDNKIEVTLSLGVETVILENYSNKDYRQVQNELSGQGFLSRVDYEKSDKVVAGYVIRTIPEGGERARKGDTVTIVVAEKEDAKQVRVPSLVGKTRKDAERLIESRKLVVGTATPVDSAEPEDTVIYQSYIEGTQVDEKTVIDYNYSNGKLAPPSTPPSTTPTDVIPTSPVTGEPVSPSPAETSTKILSVNLSDYTGAVNVTIKINGVTTHEKEYDAGLGTVNIPIQGSGHAKVDVYINGSFAYYSTVEF